MSALGTLSAGAGGVAGLLSLRRRAVPAPAAATPPQLPSVKLPDGGPLVWGRQLRPSLLLPAASQPARRHTLRQPAAAAASESAGEKRVESETESESPATQQPPEEPAASADEKEAETEKPASDSVEVEAAAESEMSTPPPPTPETVETTTRSSVLGPMPLKTEALTLTSRAKRTFR
ncbi:hypothetical protein PR202_ga24330 [Eleusine coracana subsp. coracana]|uniref:Uncharacterized protein n=1 Tax=Eleusine coracana subsp. coracana TaxID=191504 RepID=A0AAV5D826_ELECO|nr:hypothetical protein PR202_ga24330 [Eleusine coracana subsp. coracana]